MTKLGDTVSSRTLRHQWMGTQSGSLLALVSGREKVSDRSKDKGILRCTMRAHWEAGGVGVKMRAAKEELLPFQQSARG